MDKLIKGAVYALGNFDGVHRGHAALIAHARDLAAARNAPVVALTFEPHPRGVFAPDLPPFRLTTPVQKTELLRAAGADEVRALAFDPIFALVTAEDFALKVLHEEHGVVALVAGEDFRFGQGRAGDMARLAAWLHPHGIAVSAFAPVRDAGGQRYAASAIRTLLQNGQARAASAMLGRDWVLRGAVMHGDQRGRQIGYPTANLALGDYLRPQYGVYAVRARRADDSGAWLNGVANIGLRPTLDGAREWLEAHLFDFDQDIYGQEWDIALVDFIRPERKFDGIDSLRATIVEDAAAARTVLGI